MTEAKTTNIIVGLLIVGAIVTGTLAFYASLSVNYGVTSDTAAFESTYNRMEDINLEIRKAENSTRLIASENSLAFFTGVWQVTRITLGLVGDMINIGLDIMIGSFNPATGLNVPTVYIVPLLTGIFLILLLGSIIAFIRGRST